ncbi:MAG: M42 family metallopeptidase [Candidatus Bathyarchaeia archaeon]
MLQTLKALSESFGPAGFELETAKIVKEAVHPYSDEITTDKLGSVIFRKNGKADRPRVLLAGHIDEVGFVVSGIDKESGFLTFNTIGGWFDQVLLSQRVVVRTMKGDIHGIIAAKPPHVLPEEEAKQVVKRENMFIDIGATSFQEAIDMGVRIGDPVVPWSPFTTIRDGKVAIGKGFDDRIGALIAIEVFRRIRENKIEHPNTLYGAATVMEEVGLRGAATVAHVVAPDLALVLEVDIAGDVPGIKPYQAPAKMGLGPTILTFDASMIPNQRLKEFMIRLAEETKIPYQLSQIARGGTDAGRIHIDRAGCPSIVLGVPTRHIHSHVGMISVQDLENAIRLVIEAVKRLDNETVMSFTSI